MCYFRRALVASFIMAANVFLWWVVLASGVTLHEFLGWVALLAFTASSLGGYWMLYDCFRYEKKCWRRFAWAAIPFFFVWHYFERVRRRSPCDWLPVRGLRDRAR